MPGRSCPTRLYLGSGSSVLIVALWHTALNLGSATTAASGLAGMLIWIGTLAWAMAVIIAWLIADEPATRPFGRRLRDGALIGLIRSPVGRSIGGMAVVTFRGRRSGRTLATPVECVQGHGHVFIYVGQPDQKQWWRNVKANPQVTIDVQGQRVPGVATVHRGCDPDIEQDLAAYVDHHPQVARSLGLPAHGPIDRTALARAADRVVAVRIDYQPATAAVRIDQEPAAAG